MRTARLTLLSLAAALLALAPLIGCAASHHDFDSVVTAVEQRYSTHPQGVPLMGFVSLCAWVTTHGAVRDMHVAQFEHLGGDASQLESLVTGSLGGEWQRFVTERNRNGELNLIFVQPDGRGMRMLIANYDHGELDVVRMEVNGERLSQWMQDPKAHVRGHDDGAAEQGSPD